MPARKAWLQHRETLCRVADGVPAKDAAGIEIAIEQENDIGRMRRIIDDEDIGNTGEEGCPENSCQDDQQHNKGTCTQQDPREPFFLVQPPV